MHPIGENTLWTLTIQLLHAIHAAHSAGLALRDALHPSRLLMTGRNRVRINQVGVADSLDANIARIHAEGDSVGVTQATEAFMKLDVVNFGRIVLALALRTVPTISRGGMLVSSMDTALDGLSRSNMYSNDFVQFVNLLVGSRFDITTLELLQHVAPRMAHEYANVRKMDSM